MVFDDIVGQYNVIRSIKNSIKYNRVAHAYLFCGPDGVGKSVAASILASALNCKESTVDPCGKCPSCIRAGDGNHPDIIHVKTQKATIHVNEVRELQRDMQKKPYEKGVKVYIIHDAEKMNAEAQNCLLKTLEEPPEHVTIILLSKSQYSMLSTIVSRCQVLKFARAPEKDIENYLTGKLNISPKQAAMAAAYSDGYVGKALSFLNDDDFKNVREEVVEISKKIYENDKHYALSRIDYFIDNKDKIDMILDIMLCWFRDIGIFMESGSSK
jgi:DNA polymerase-3 subunit delta'